MNQQTQSPQFEIPRQADRPDVQQDVDALPSPVVSEKLLSQPELNSPGLVAQSTQQPVHTIQIPAVMSISDPTSAQQAHANQVDGVKAEDVDVIEKEWVERAKKVLAQTAEDPYVGVKQVSLLKAEYMRKRFNRELKLPEEAGEQR